MSVLAACRLHRLHVHPYGISSHACLTDGGGFVGSMLAKDHSIGCMVLTVLMHACSLQNLIFSANLKFAAWTAQPCQVPNFDLLNDRAFRLHMPHLHSCDLSCQTEKVFGSCWKQGCITSRLCPWTDSKGLSRIAIHMVETAAFNDNPHLPRDQVALRDGVVLLKLLAIHVAGTMTVLALLDKARGCWVTVFQQLQHTVCEN